MTKPTETNRAAYPQAFRDKSKKTLRGFRLPKPVQSHLCTAFAGVPVEKLVPPTRREKPTQ